jgi:hypothetical protein
MPSPTAEVTLTHGSPDRGGYQAGDAWKWLNDGWIVFGIAQGPITGNPVTVEFAQGCQTDLAPFPARVCGTRKFNLVNIVYWVDGTPVPMSVDEIQPGDFLAIDGLTHEALLAADGSGPYDCDAVRVWK